MLTVVKRTVPGSDIDIDNYVIREPQESDKIDLDDPKIAGCFKRLAVICQDKPKEEEESYHKVPFSMVLSDVGRDSDRSYGPRFRVHSISLLDDETQPPQSTSNNGTTDSKLTMNGLAQEHLNGMFPNQTQGTGASSSGKHCYTLARHYESRSLWGDYTISVNDLPAKYNNFKAINIPWDLGQQIYDHREKVAERRKSSGISKSSNNETGTGPEDDRLTVNGELHCVFWKTDSANPTHEDYIKQLPAIKARLAGEEGEDVLSLAKQLSASALSASPTDDSHIVKSESEDSHA